MDIMKEIETINTMLNQLQNHEITCFFKDVLVEYQRIHYDKTKKNELNVFLKNMSKKDDIGD